MSSEWDTARQNSSGPLDTNFHVALARLSRAYIEEIDRLTRKAKDQLHQAQTHSTGILQSGLPVFHANEAAEVTACRSFQLSLMNDIRRSYFTLGSEINEVFDNPSDAAGELGDTFSALVGVYVELAVEIFGIQENLAEHSMAA